MLIYYTSFHDQNPVHTRTVMQQIGYHSMFYTVLSLNGMSIMTTEYNHTIISRISQNLDYQKMTLI